MPFPTCAELLQRRLFAVTRRSLHADLQILTELGWQASGVKNITEYTICPLVLYRQLRASQCQTKCLPALVNPDLETIARNLSQPLGVFSDFLRG